MVDVIKVNNFGRRKIDFYSALCYSATVVSRDAKPNTAGRIEGNDEIGENQASLNFHQETHIKNNSTFFDTFFNYIENPIDACKHKILTNGTLLVRIKMMLYDAE